jgi:hypothetical protein
MVVGLRRADGAEIDGIKLKPVEGRVKKKPTSQLGKPWAASTPQSRVFESRGFSVSYFSNEASRRAKQPKATFDLREVTKLCEVRWQSELPNPRKMRRRCFLLLLCAESG